MMKLFESKWNYSKIESYIIIILNKNDNIPNYSYCKRENVFLLKFIQITLYL